MMESESESEPKFKPDHESRAVPRALSLEAQA